MLKEYYALVKPGIIYGNAITASAGFLLASRGSIDLSLFIAMLAGIVLVMASGCVINNYIDRDIDAIMERTQKRPLVTGTIPLRHALVLGGALGILGFGVLYMYVNALAAMIALLGWYVYVVIYSLWLKRASVWGTPAGAISGAVPPVVGYVAVTGHIDGAAGLLFVILMLWQMPHSYAVALYRKHDYTTARLPVFSVRNSAYRTSLHSTFYIVCLMFAMALLWVLEYAGPTFFALGMLLGFWWLVVSARGMAAHDITRWARSMFLISIVMILGISVMLSLNVI